MARVIVLGAGIVGMNAAFVLRKKLDSQHAVTLVAREDQFVWRPSLPWVAFGLRRPEQIVAPIRASLERRGIDFLHAGIELVDPHRREVLTEAGPVPYDYAVIGLGAQLDWDAVPGAAEHGQIICRMDGARRMREAVLRLKKGNAVLGVASTAGCAAPAYECTFLLEDFLRRSGRRKDVNIHFVTVESKPLEVSGPAPVRIVEAEFRKLGIHVYLNKGIARVNAGQVILTDGTSIPSDFTLIMPPYRGSQAMLASPDLVDGKGFVGCDLSMRHPRFPEVFSAGDGAALDALKTGHHAELQAKVAAQNIASLLRGRRPEAVFQPEIFCNMPLGGTKALLGIWRPAPPANTNFQVQVTYAGRIPLWMKAAFERYYLWKVR